jgi:hypothetical protein
VREISADLRMPVSLDNHSRRGQMEAYVFWKIS